MVAWGFVCAIALGLLATPSSFAGERALEEAPPPSSVKEIESPLERAHPKPEVRRSLFPSISRQVQQFPPFLADSKLYLRPRTYYLRQDRTSGRLSEAWAIGSASGSPLREPPRA